MMALGTVAERWRTANPDTTVRSNGTIDLRYARDRTHQLALISSQVVDSHATGSAFADGLTARQTESRDVADRLAEEACTAVYGVCVVTGHLAYCA